MPQRAHFFAFDTETTGVDPEKSQILSIAMVVLDMSLTPIATKEVHAFPDENAVIDPEAVRVNGYTEEAWKEKGAVTQKEMFQQVQLLLKNHWRLKPVAHNLPFDAAFLKALFKRFARPPRDRPYNDLFSYFGLDTLGVAVFADLVLHDQCRSTYKLSSLSEHYKIKHADAHTALSDVLAMVDVLKAMRDNLRTSAGVGAFARVIPDNHLLACTDKETPVWTFTGGKHSGETADVVAKTDLKYLKFVLTFPDLSDAQRQYLNTLCQNPS
jgi:DNA polymerase-3 subunit epsilon